MAKFEHGNFSTCIAPHPGQPKRVTTPETTLDNKLKTVFCICDEYVINLFVCIYDVRKGTQKITWL